MTVPEGDAQVANGSNASKVQLVRKERGQSHIPTRLAKVVDRMKATSRKPPAVSTRMTRVPASNKNAIADAQMNGYDKPRDSVGTHEDARTLRRPVLVSPASRPTRASKRRPVGTGNGDISLQKHAPASHSQHRSGGVDPAENSAASSDDDEQDVEDMLLSKATTKSLDKAPNPVAEPSSILPRAEAGPSTDILAPIQQDSLPLTTPQCGDSYDTGAEFISHVRSFARQGNHVVYQHGGSRPYVIRMVCRNWKKPEYKPPGLGCTFLFIAQRPVSDVSGRWTIACAQPDHIEACQKREQLALVAARERAARNSKVGTKRSAEAGIPSATRPRGRPRKVL